MAEVSAGVILSGVFLSTKKNPAKAVEKEGYNVAGMGGGGKVSGLIWLHRTLVTDWKQASDLQN